MKCIVCGNIIDECEDKILVDIDGDFMHNRCQPMWENFKDRINNMSDAEFNKYLLGDRN